VQLIFVNTLRANLPVLGGRIVSAELPDRRLSPIESQALVLRLSTQFEKQVQSFFRHFFGAAEACLQKRN
jgi:hypothetical protein